MRPINNVVDITNYVMLEMGQPLHAFDFRTLAGGEIVVRRAREGEKLRTLDGVVRDLDPSDLMIADAERAIALAGIMGGEETEIGEGTNDVLLEAANFEPTRLWRTSERLRLRTEGSNRWEKGVDPYLAEQAAIWATELLVELTAARWVGHTDAKDELPGRPVVRFDPSKASDYIGLEVAADEQRDILARLGLEARDGEYVVPTWRARDLTRGRPDRGDRLLQADVVPFTLPVRREMTGSLTRTQRTRRRVEDARRPRLLRGVHAVARRGRRRSACAAAAGAITVELAVLRTELLPRSSRLVVGTSRSGTRVALFEIARAHLCGRGRAAGGTGACRGDRRGTSSG
jgi:phenylalanyl-tRNA synthetase beta chain